MLQEYEYTQSLTFKYNTKLKNKTVNGEKNMTEQNNLIGNSTTIINTLIVAIAGIIFGKYGATLLQLGIDQTILIQILSFIIFTAFAYINAKNHNTYFNKTETVDPTTTPTNTDTEIFDNDAPILNDEYTTNDSDEDGC